MNDEALQSTHYDPMVVSTAQHLKVEHGYFREMDSEDIAALNGLETSSRSGGSSHSSEASQLKQDLDSVTLEANRRIEKANETILRLKSQLREMAEKETPLLVRAHTDVQRRMEMIQESHHELQNRMYNEDYDEELDQLRGEVMVLTEQKAALMDSVQELYTAGGGTADAPQTSNSRSGSEEKK